MKPSALKVMRSGARWVGESRRSNSLCKSCLRARQHSWRLAASAPKMEGGAYDYGEYGVSVTKDEEKLRIRQIMRLLYAGNRLEEEMSKAVESGEVDEKTLAVLHHKISKTREKQRQTRNEKDEGDEEDDTTLRALSILYARLQQEYRKRNISPSMKLLSDALDVLLVEDEDETERLLRVKDLLDAHFVQADLGLDPISAASIFARAETSREAQHEIDSYLRGRMQKNEFVAEVEERLQSLQEEFAVVDRKEQQKSSSGSEDGWIENIEKQNLYKTQRMQREKILKYLKYVIDLANNYN